MSAHDHIPTGSVLTTGQVLSIERRGPMTDDEALRFGRAVESATLRAVAGEKTVYRVARDRSYSQRARAIVAFNTCTGDLDDKLEAAWLATLEGGL
jgi:hypothetical protein